jgi:hypothetical protein
MPMQIRNFTNPGDQRLHELAIMGLQIERQKMEERAKQQSKKLVHTPQKRIGQLIAYKFFTSDTLIATLCASMQWGKTGVILEVAFTMTTHIDMGIDPENVFVVTGMSDNEWREQTIERLPSDFQVFHRGNLKRLLPALRDVTNALIVIDECHYGANETSVISSTLKEAGLLDILALQQRNVRIFQTSATPDHVLTNAEEWNQPGGVGYHYKCIPESPPTYVSPKEIMSDGRIRQVMDLTDPASVAELRTQMLGYTSPKYHIIRLPNSTKKKDTVRENIMAICSELDFVIATHDTDSRIAEVNQILCQSPTKHTIILIKNMWRAAKTIPDTNLGILHEAYAANSSDSSVAQSFVGRCCGHNANRTVSAPVIYCNVESIEHYIKLMDSAYNYSHPTLDYHALNIDKTSGSEPTLKDSWAAAANVEGLDAVEREHVGARAQPEPLVRKYASFADAKDYHKKIARKAARLMGKDPQNINGCQYPTKHLNADGFFECNVRSNSKVWSTMAMHEERRWGMGENYYRLRYCYRDTTDSTTLEWWVIHDRSLIIKASIPQLSF